MKFTSINKVSRLNQPDNSWMMKTAIFLSFGQDYHDQAEGLDMGAQQLEKKSWIWEDCVEDATVETPINQF